MIDSIIFIIALILMAGFSAFVYRQGINDGYSLSRGEPPKAMVERKIPPKPPDREEIIRANIENYNGGSEGQLDYDL